jgi:hypothetical protein
MLIAALGVEQLELVKRMLWRVLWLLPRGYHGWYGYGGGDG